MSNSGSVGQIDLTVIFIAAKETFINNNIGKNILIFIDSKPSA